MTAAGDAGAAADRLLGPAGGEGMSPLDRIRALCLALPEVTEKVSHGEPTWFVRRVFVSFAHHHHDDRVAFWCAAPPGAQEALVAARPDRYFRPPYVGGRGWLGVWLDADPDWEEIGEIVLDAYRVIAPKKLAALLDRLAAPTNTTAPIPTAAPVEEHSA